MKKFTFKTEHPTGKYRSFYGSTHYIKYDKRIVGVFKSDKNELYKISLQIMKNDKYTDDNPNCLWKWITFKNSFETLDGAKLWLNENREIIHNSVSLINEGE